MRSNDELFREIASKYTEQYGEALRAEGAQLERSPAPSTVKLERRVRARIAAQKRKPYLRLATALAACLAIVVLAARVLPTQISNPPPSDAQPSAAPTLEYAVIPLSAPLPEGFVQTGFEQDKAKSIYYIEDASLDSIVITLEHSTVPSDTAGLTAIPIGGATAYGTQTDSYSLLTFSRDDVVYELTCKYDINTLIRLGEVFL